MVQYGELVTGLGASLAALTLAVAELAAANFSLASGAF